MSGKIDTYVSVTDEAIYPARVDLSHRWNGWLSPHFTLPTARRIAADTQRMAEEGGYDYAETIHVIEGGTNRQHEPRAVVVHVSWRHADDEGPEQYTSIIEPDDDGLYAIGGFEWAWYQVADGPLATAHRLASAARADVLRESARKVGEIIRRLAPEATKVAVDFTDSPRIYAVAAGDTLIWSVEDESYEPFDAETLGEADQVLLDAVEFGATSEGFRSVSWRQIPNGRGADFRMIPLPAMLPAPTETSEDDSDTETSGE